MAHLQLLLTQLAPYLFHRLWLVVQPLAQHLDSKAMR